MAREIDPQHQKKQILLRRIGLPLIALGGLLILIGIGNFFMSFGSFGPPRYFWCAFLGMPILFVGIVLTSYGYMGAVARYAAGESAPVAKDTLNYMVEGTQDSIKTVATAVGSGLAAGLGKTDTMNGVHCLKCNAINQAEAKFCDQCGFALQKTKACPTCQELNDPDAKFCDNCGGAF